VKAPLVAKSIPTWVPVFDEGTVTETVFHEPLRCWLMVSVLEVVVPSEFFTQVVIDETVVFESSRK
jgi:hypothetical protein